VLREKILTNEGGLLTMSRRRSKVSNQKGFTLIEIIAVLVILGILAAVAIPRFMDLTTVASDKAAMQAVAEGKSRLSNQFARNLLSGATNTVDFMLNQVNVVDPTLKNAGDYTLTFTKVSNSQINVKADGVGSVKGTNSSTWIRPQ
jgi:prepilin-type N-terminal cleavage/methylation domain-containing protein